MNVHSRLPQLFALLVFCAVLAFAYSALHEPPSSGKTQIGLTPIGWQPSVSSIFVWCALFAAVSITPWNPTLGLAAYLLTEYSCYRYGPELEFVYMSGLTELVATGTAVGTAIWWYDNPEKRAPVNARLAWLLSGLVAWAAISALAVAIRHGHFQFEPQHHPVRYLNGLLLFGVAAVGVRRPLDLLLLTGALYGALAWRTIQFSQANHLDGDLGCLAAIALPLTLGSLGLQRPWVVRVIAAAAAVHLGWLLISIQSRGAIVAASVGLLVIWLQSRFRWVLLLLATPAMVGVVYFSYHNGLYERVRGSLPGGATYASVESRFALWDLAWQTAKANPLLGIGPGEFAELRQRTTGGSAKVAHNNFLAVVAELGFPGLILYSALFLSAIIFLTRAKRDKTRWAAQSAPGLAAALVAYLAGGMFMTRQDQALAYMLLGCASAILTQSEVQEKAGAEVA